MFPIIKREVILFLRNKSSLFFVCLFPTLLIFILGTALEDFNNAEGTKEPFGIAVFVAEDGSFFEAAAMQFLAGIEEQGFTIVTAKTAEEPYALVESGIADTGLVMGQGGITIVNGTEPINNDTLRIMCTAFAQSAASAQTVFAEHPEVFVAPDAANSAELVAEKEFGFKRTMLDYYSVTVIVLMFFMSGGITGAEKITEGRKDGTLRRMTLGSRSLAVLWIETVLSSLPETLLQVAFIMLPSVVFFKVRYAVGLANNLLLITMFVFVNLAVSSAVMLVGTFYKRGSVVPFLFPLCWTLLFLSGSFSSFVDDLIPFANILPPKIIQDAAFDLTIFGNAAACVNVTLGSAFVFLVCALVGAFAFGKKEVL